MSKRLVVNRLSRFLLLASVSLMLAACASKPIETDATLGTLTPSEASRSLSEGADDTDLKVMWGGVIVSSSNLKEATQLEVLAYPLDGKQKPQRSKPAEGRFLIVAEGYLETVDYSSGRLVTVLGPLQGITEGLVGETRYSFPTVNVEQLHLWDESSESQRTGFSFGLGISL